MKNRKLVFGVGVTDVDYITQKYERYTDSNGKRKSKKVWECPYYVKWVSMLRRCYSKYALTSRLTYENCYVCDEWKYLSNFILWVDSQPETNWKNLHLDKDFLVLDNKIYSPKTCVFIHSKTNSFLTARGADRGKSSFIGVTVDTGNKTNPFIAECSDPFSRYKAYIARFSVELEAHKAWQVRKHKYALELAEIEPDFRVKDVLRNRYKEGTVHY